MKFAAIALALFCLPSAAAEWALGELDRPVGETAARTYPLPSGEVVRVDFVPNVTGSMAMQELLTVLRGRRRSEDL